MTHAVLDLFAGSGFGVALQRLGVEEHGVENAPAAIATRLLNNMATPYQNVWDAHKAEMLRFDTLLGGPPCQTYSLAGNGAGRAALDTVLSIVENQDYEDIEVLHQLSLSMGDDRIGLVLSPLHYVHKYRPTYVILEQVPPVMPIWQATAEVMRSYGYSAWTGFIHAEQYGVPQTRKRAYLIARLDGITARPPQPINSRFHVANTLKIDPGTKRWTAIEDVLTPRGTNLAQGTRDNSPTRSVSQPAGTMAFGNDFGSFRWVNRAEYSSTYDAVKSSKEYLTIHEAQILQSYPADFVFAGNKAERVRQIGNAVPPLVAGAVLEELWSALWSA